MKHIKCPACGKTVRAGGPYVSHCIPHVKSGHMKKTKNGEGKVVLELVKPLPEEEQYKEKKPEEFRCPLCDREFANKGALLSHCKSHVREGTLRKDGNSFVPTGKKKNNYDKWHGSAFFRPMKCDPRKPLRGEMTNGKIYVYCRHCNTKLEATESASDERFYRAHCNKCDKLNLLQKRFVENGSFVA